MSNQSAALKYTAADYRRMPDGPPHWQLIEGDLVQDPPPSIFHQSIAMNLSVALGSYVRTQSLGRLWAGPAGVWLTENNVFEPDLMFVSQARQLIIAADGIHGAPDLVVEIISPSGTHRDSVQKRRVYETAGVREYWLIDPECRRVSVFRFAEQRSLPVQIATTEDILRSACFPRLDLPVAEIFRES